MLGLFSRNPQTSQFHLENLFLPSWKNYESVLCIADTNQSLRVQSLKRNKWAFQRCKGQNKISASCEGCQKTICGKFVCHCQASILFSNLCVYSLCFLLSHIETFFFCSLLIFIFIYCVCFLVTCTPVKEYCVLKYIAFYVVIYIVS